MKRWFVLFLLAALALSLCACGEKSGAGAPEAASLKTGGGEGWSLCYLPLPEGVLSTGCQCTDGTSIFLAGTGPDGRAVLGRYDGETFTPYEVPEDLESLPFCFPTGDGGLGAVASVEAFTWLGDHLDRWETPPTELLLYDGEGRLLSRQDMTEALSEMERLGKFRYEEGSEVNFQIRSVAWLDGCLCVAGDRSLFLLDSTLRIQRSFTDLGNIGPMAASPRGLLLFVYAYTGSGEAEDYLTVLGLSAPDAEPETLFRCHNWGYDDGLDLLSMGYTPEGELLLDIAGDRICKAAPPDGLGETLFSFYEAGTGSGAGDPILPWSGGYLLSGGGDELMCLRYGPLPEKTALTMWIDRADYTLLAPYLQRYNLSDAPYLIRSDDEITQQEAATELAAGRGPDLYAFAGGSFMDWSDTTVFEELSPYLAASGRSRADFLPSLMEAVNPGEEMYSVPLGFILALFVQNTALQPDPMAPFSASYALPQVQDGGGPGLPGEQLHRLAGPVPRGFHQGQPL